MQFLKVNRFTALTDMDDHLRVYPFWLQWEVSTRPSVVTLCSWGVKAGMVHSTCGFSVWVAGKTG